MGTYDNFSIITGRYTGYWITAGSNPVLSSILTTKPNKMKNSVITILLLCLSLLASAQVDVKWVEGLSNLQSKTATNIEVNCRIKPVSVSLGFLAVNSDISDAPMVFFTKVGGNIDVGQHTFTPAVGVSYHDYNSTKYAQQGYHLLYGVAYQSAMQLNGRIISTVYVTQRVVYMGVGISYTFKSPSYD
jgi:hypothetical protein